MKIIFCAALLLASLTSQAGNWIRIEVPGAKCGGGGPYAVFVRPGQKEKVLFAFQGGGACWNYVTCRAIPGFTPMSLGVRVRIPDSGLLSNLRDESPLADYTAVYFPYCTGDAYAGRHTARYSALGLSATIHHWGAINVARGLRQLMASGIVDTLAATDVVVYGFSSGALGAIFNVYEINAVFRPGQRKIAILDSPGLHFGANFWQKFSREMINDYASALADLGVPFDRSDGNLARHAPELAARFSDWQVGVLQGTRDWVMSMIFSNMTPVRHEQIVRGPDGIFEATVNPYDNVSAWIPTSLKHTFLAKTPDPSITAGGIQAMEFVQELLDGYGGLTYADPL